MRVLCVLLAVSAVLFGCASEPKIDGSSDEALQQSLERVKEGLDEDQREEFAEALMVVALEDVSVEDLFSESTSPEELQAKAIKAMNGMTATEIMAKADRVLAKRKLEEKRQAMTEIAELQAREAAADSVAKELAKFTILRSRFYKRKDTFSDDPIIELTVRNDTPYPISRAYFRGTLASPGRSIPWLTDEFNYKISGGLEPGEEATWHLAPNMFSDWGKVEVRPDMVLTVNVLRLDGPNEEPVLHLPFTDDDEARLSALRKEFLE